MKNESSTSISYEKYSVTDFRGITRDSYKSSVGDTTYHSFSLEELKELITNHKTKNDFKAAVAFYNTKN